VYTKDGLPSGYLDLIITHTLKVFHRLGISTGEPQYIKRVTVVELRRLRSDLLWCYKITFGCIR